MRRVQYALAIAVFLTAPVLCHGQELQSGEIRLVVKIVSIEATRNLFFLTVERFVLPPNHEGVPKMKRNQLVTGDGKTLLCYQDGRDKKLRGSEPRRGTFWWHSPIKSDHEDAACGSSELSVFSIAQRSRRATSAHEPSMSS